MGYNLLLGRNNMIDKLKQNIIFMGILSFFLLAIMLFIMVFNIIVVEGKYNQQLFDLNKINNIVIANKGLKNNEKIPIFQLSEHVSAILKLVNKDPDMNVYTDYLNMNITAFNSLSRGHKVLSGKISGNDSFIQLMATGIREQLKMIRRNALSHPKLLKSYKDRDIKRAIALLQDITTPTVSQSGRIEILQLSHKRIIDEIQNTTAKMILGLHSDKKGVMLLLYAMGIFFLLILFVQFKLILSLRREANEFKTKVLFIRNYLRENNGSDHNSYSDDAPLEYLYNEAKISIGVLANKNRLIKNSQEKIKKSNILAGMIGHEINGLTSIIAGGLSLNKKIGLHNTTFTQEISGALASLEVISDNFDHLFSAKDPKSNKNQDFNLHNLLNKIFELITSTCRGLNKYFDFIIEDSVPKMICGDEYRFYWCLYNILVRCVEGIEQEFCLLHISTTKDTNTENKILHINILSTSGKYPSLSSFLDRINQIKVDHDAYNTNSQLCDRIIQHFFEGTVRFKENDSGDSRIAINITITANNDDEKAQLKSSNVLIYAKDGLETSIIMKKVEQIATKAILRTNSKELFEHIQNDDCINFIFISDDLLLDRKILKELAIKTTAKIMILSSLKDPVKTKNVPKNVIIQLPIFQQALIKVLSNNGTPEQELKTVKVLIVDDDPSQQFILSHFLQRIGIESILASNGDEAIALVKDNTFDLVFMDCNMPGKDGFETTQIIRVNEEATKLRGQNVKQATIIANTSLTAASDIDKCIESGMNAVLNKPYENKKILDLLARYN